MGSESEVELNSEIERKYRLGVFASRRKRIERAREIDRALESDLQRKQRPYRIALAVLILVLLVAVPLFSPLLGGGIFLAWGIMALVFVFALMASRPVQRWRQRREKIRGSEDSGLLH